MLKKRIQSKNQRGFHRTGSFPMDHGISTSPADQLNRPPCHGWLFFGCITQRRGGPIWRHLGSLESQLRQRFRERVRNEEVNLLSQMLHVWHIYLHLVDFWGKCRWIFMNIPYMEHMGIGRWFVFNISLAKWGRHGLTPHFSTVHIPEVPGPAPPCVDWRIIVMGPRPLCGDLPENIQGIPMDLTEFTWIWYP
jgi:hypothetical protein